MMKYAFNEKPTLDEEENKLEEDLTKGHSIASKVMEELFKKKKAVMTEAEIRKEREKEEVAKQRQIQHDQEYEKAIQNYVKQAAA